MQRSSLLILGVLVLVGFGLRLAYWHHATSQQGYEWVDPDHYKLKGRRLAGSGEGWRWTFDAVRHSAADQRYYVLPPAYPVFLSLFAMFPGYPSNAQVGQIVLSTGSIVLLFLMGRLIHSDRAGHVAAGIYALWLPNVIAVWSTMQEALYIPVVLAAFVLLLEAFRRETNGWLFAATGLVFGLAALTRSMPLYVLPVLAALLLARGRRAGLKPVILMVVGFLVTTVPYSVALSKHLGQPTFIENHGSIMIVERYGGVEGEDPAGLVQTASILASAFLAAPTDTVLDWIETTRSLLHVNGGRLLQIYLGAATKTGAVLSKWAVHLFGDGLFVATLLLAPFGFALCQRPWSASFLVAWILANVALTALSGFGGPRLRAPFEPHLIALGAVTLSGGYQRGRLWGVATAAATTLALVMVVLPQVPASLKAHADYGVHWPMKLTPKRSAAMGDAGLNVLAIGGQARFYVRSRNPGGATRINVYAEGAPTESILLEDGEHRFAVPWPRLELVYVELEARDSVTGEPAQLFIVVPRPRT